MLTSSSVSDTTAMLSLSVDGGWLSIANCRRSASRHGIRTMELHHMTQMQGLRARVSISFPNMTAMKVVVFVGRGSN